MHPHLFWQLGFHGWASDCQCNCCNGPRFDPSIRRLSGIWGAANKKSPPKIFKIQFLSIKTYCSTKVESRLSSSHSSHRRAFSFLLILWLRLQVSWRVRRIWAAAPSHGVPRCRASQTTWRAPSGLTGTSSTGTLSRRCAPPRHNHR